LNDFEGSSASVDIALLRKCAVRSLSPVTAVAACINFGPLFRAARRSAMLYRY